MPANLTPQYKEAEQRYRQARTLPAKVAALQEMMAVIPKHKGTDHMRADLRARMSRHMEELEKPKSTSGGPQPFSIRKEGAGQVLIIGLPNAGKSEILNALTRAPAKVGDYPFTTQIPMVGMLPFENVLFQLVDTPALNALDVQTRLFGLLRNTDLLLVTVNLEGDPLKEMDQINGLLYQWGYSLLEEGEAIDPEGSRIQKLSIILGNKADADGARGEVSEAGAGLRREVHRYQAIVPGRHGAGRRWLSGVHVSEQGEGVHQEPQRAAGLQHPNRDCQGQHDFRRGPEAAQRMAGEAEVRAAMGVGQVRWSTGGPRLRSGGRRRYRASRVRGTKEVHS